MGRIVVLCAFLMVFSRGNGQEENQSIKKGTATNEKIHVFGNEISALGAISDGDMYNKYLTMSNGDSSQSKFAATVTDVCQVKGCWMKLRLKDDNLAMVRFKDYGFFVPKDIVGKEVIVSGLAFVDEMSVADQRHYAKDAGKSLTEIERITEPRKTFGFEAVGVLLTDGRETESP